MLLNLPHKVPALHLYVQKIRPGGHRSQVDRKYNIPALMRLHKKLSLLRIIERKGDTLGFFQFQAKQDLAPGRIGREGTLADRGR